MTEDNGLTRVRAYAMPVVAASLSFVVIVLLASVLLMLGGASPSTALAAMVDGALGSWANLGETFIRMTPVLLIALGLIPSLRIGLFNIGAPGQIAFGGLFATLASQMLAGCPSIVVLPVACVAGALGGLLWALLPGLLRAYAKVNEILSTLVFNYIAVLFLQYLLTGPMRGARANLPQSETLPDTALLPLLMDGTRMHVGLLLALAAVVVALILHRMPIGYRLKLAGASPSLARQAGINERRMIVAAMCVAGAAAGVAGWIQVSGVDQRLYASIAGSIGYTGLFAALLGQLHPLGTLVAGFAFSALLRGGESLQVGAGVSPEITSALVGLTLLIISFRSARRSARGLR